MVLVAPFIEHMPHLESLAIDWIPETASMWIGQLERLQARPPLRNLSLDVSKNLHYVGWHNILLVLDMFPQLSHCRLTMASRSYLPQPDYYAYLVVQTLVKKCESLRLFNVGDSFSDLAFEHWLSSERPDASCPLPMAGAEPASYNLTKLRLKGASSHVIKGWTLPMFANLTHLTLISVYDHSHPWSEPFPKLPSLVFLRFDLSLTHCFEPSRGLMVKWRVSTHASV